MEPFESADNKQETFLDGDTVQFEDLDAPGTERSSRWERLFTRRSRRSWLPGAIVISLVCLLLVLTPLVSSLHNTSPPAIAASVHAHLEAITSQFIYEVQSEPGIIRALSRSDGTQVWSYQASAPITDAQAPTTGDNGLILAGDFLYIHVDNTQVDRIYALRTATGELLWQYDLAPVFASTSLNMIVANGIVYESSFKGDVIALQGHTGKVLWTYQQNSVEQPEDVQFNLIDNVIYLLSQTTQQTQALNATTGSILWHVYRPAIFVAINSGIIYLKDNFNYLYAFQAHSGTSLWKSSQQIFTGGYVIAAGDLFIYTQADGSIAALHIKTARQVWQTPPAALLLVNLYLLNNHLYVVDSDARHSLLMSLDSATGRVLWQSSGFTLLQMEGVGDHLYIRLASNRIFVLQAATGKSLWLSSAKTEVDQLNNASSTAIDLTFQMVDNRLFITKPGKNTTSILTVLSDTDGHVLWQKNISGTPLLWGGNVYANGIDGTVYAYKADSGKQIWSVR